MTIRNCLKLLSELGQLESQIQDLEHVLKELECDLDLDLLLRSIYQDQVKKGLN